MPSEALRRCLHHTITGQVYEALGLAIRDDQPAHVPVDVTISVRFPNVKPAEKLDDRFR